MTEESLSHKHAIVTNDRELLNKKQRPKKVVYMIDGMYIGSTNDFKRRVREYIGRAIRKEPRRSDTPIMRYIKERLESGHKIKFCILSDDPWKEFIYINRYHRRGVTLLNVKMTISYKDAEMYGKPGFYKRFKQSLNG